MKNNIKLLIFLLIGFTNIGYSQYWGERVLEKSFEVQDFFFKSNYLNPYGLGNFVNATPGLIEDPYLNLIVNPGNMYADTAHATDFYLDFRSVKNVAHDYGGIMPMYEYARTDMMYYYPNYYTESRKELLPLFSLGLLNSSLKLFGKRIPLGFTYQMIMVDEDYYSVPFDIYRSSIGYDYAGNRSAETSDIQIVDRYSGEDKMYQIGHFVSFFSGIQLCDKLGFGVRLNRTTFDRDGDVGSQNLWDSYYNYNSSSYWYYMESRNQNYQHWDFSGGIKYKINPKISVGITGGYLWGDVTQAMSNNDTSLYQHGEIGAGDNWNFYSRSGTSLKNWDHDGTTYYGGLDCAVKLDPKKMLNFYYTYNKQNVDIYLKSSTADTSYSNYYYHSIDYFYSSESDYALTDIRAGTGSEDIAEHRFFASLHWQMEERLNLDMGLFFQQSEKKSQTFEAVFSDRHSGGINNSSYNPGETEYFSKTVEDKKLYWDFRTKLTTVQIPIVLTYKVTDKADLLFGINRKMSRWQIDDQTLAIFNYREITDNSNWERKENFGERYTEPTEKKTDVSTSIMGGLTIKPSKLFKIRMMVMPNFRDSYNGSELSELQWWIGITMLP